MELKTWKETNLHYKISIENKSLYIIGKKAEKEIPKSSETFNFHANMLQGFSVQGNLYHFFY